MLVIAGTGLEPPTVPNDRPKAVAAAPLPAGRERSRLAGARGMS